MVITATFCHYKIRAQRKLIIMSIYLSLFFLTNLLFDKIVRFIFLTNFSLRYRQKRLLNYAK